MIGKLVLVLLLCPVCLGCRAEQVEITAVTSEGIVDLVDELAELLGSENMKTLKHTNCDTTFMLNWGLASSIRTTFRLWDFSGPNSQLFQSAGINDPDDMSGILIDAIACFDEFGHDELELLVNEIVDRKSRREYYRERQRNIKLYPEKYYDQRRQSFGLKARPRGFYNTENGENRGRRE